MAEDDLEELRYRLELEQRVYDGALNLLQVFEGESDAEIPLQLQGQSSESKEALRKQVSDELQAASSRISALQRKIASLGGSLEADGAQGDADLQDGSQHHLRFAKDLIRGSETRKIASKHLRGLADLPESEAIVNLNATADLVLDGSQLPIELACSCLMPLLVDSSSISIRASVYRLLRRFMTSSEAIVELQRCHLDIYLVKALSRDARHDIEKQQAVRTVRHILQYPGRLSVALLKAVVAVAENGEDKLRLVCLELLAELVICDIQLLCRADGLRIVLQALADGPYEVSPTLASLFVYLVDVPRLRSFLRPGMDLEMALAGLNEATGKGHYFAERTKASVRIVCMLVKSWSGLLYLYSENRLAIAGLVQSLYLPAVQICETILDTLYDIFRVKTGKRSHEVAPGRRHTISRRSKGAKARDHGAHKAEMLALTRFAAERAPMRDQFLGLLLLVFVDAGLLEALIHVAEGTKHASLSKKAALLIGEILYLANHVLPVQYVSRVQALPRLFELAAAFTEDLPRLAATTALCSVDSFARDMARLQSHETAALATRDLKLRTSSAEDPLSRGQRVVETSKVKVGIQIDDTAFRNLLVDTQVLTAPKEDHKWNIDALLELFEGPLLNPTRFDEVNKGSKFLRRLMVFFYPFEGRFADLPRSSKNERWAKLASAVLTALLSNPEGIRFLQGDKLLKQLGDALLLLNPTVDDGSTESILSKKRFEHTMSYAYLDMIGLLTKTDEGVGLLEKFHIFSGLYFATDLVNREEILRKIVEALDYSSDGHPRIIFSKALTSGSKHIRIFATRHLGHLLRNADEEPPQWMIRLLLTQLYDPLPEVCSHAVELLDEACGVPEVLELVVSLRPSLGHLGDLGAPLLFRFLASPVGVRYLYSVGYIDRELGEWYEDRNQLYVIQVELQMAQVFDFDHGKQKHTKSMPRLDVFFGAMPPHFYGELVKTAEGREILLQKGHLYDFAEFIRQHGLEDQLSARITQLKSILWAVGNIGASEEGLSILESQDLVGMLVNIAQSSLCYSVRGTCFYVLGLIANTKRGVELLEEQGWIAACTPLGSPVGVVIPADLDAFLSVPKSPKAPQIETYSPLVPPHVHAEREAITAIANLTNHLLTHKSSKTLAKIRSRQAEVFTSPEMYFRALYLLETLHYRLPARRFILDLFTLELTPEMLAKVAQNGAALRSAAAAHKPAVIDSPNNVPVLSTWSAPAMTGGADFSDEEEDDAVETVERQHLTPQYVHKGFSIKQPAITLVH